jgi:hypothetical protein
LLQHRLPKSSLAWAVGTVEGQFVELLHLLRGRDPQWELFIQSRSLAVGLVLEDDVRLRGDFQGRDAKSALALQHWMNLHLPRDKKTKIVGPSPASVIIHAVTQCAAVSILPAAISTFAACRTLPAGPEALWVNWQMRAEPKKIREMLHRGSGWIPKSL